MPTRTRAPRRAAAAPAPVLRLPSVDLPPPGGAEAKPPTSLALRAVVSVALLGGVMLHAVLVVVAMVAANVFTLQQGRLYTGLVIAAGVVILALGRALIAMFRTPPEPDDELEVPVGDEPELHAFVREIAEAAGTRPPDRIVLVADTNAYVREWGPMMGLVRGTRTMAIGAPLLDVIDVSQLRAVLGHELGHLSGGDTRLAPVAYRTEVALVRILDSLRGRAFISKLFIAYWKLQHRVGAGVRRGQELTADRVAVRVAGRQAAADALHAIDIAARAEMLLRYAYLAPLLEAGARPDDIAAGHRALLADDARVAGFVADATSENAGGHDPWASHPPTPVRIARVAALEDTGDVTHDNRAARVLLRDPDRWIAAAHDRWLKSATGRDDFRVVTWDEWGALVAGATQAARAEVVDGALRHLDLQPGVDGVRDALDSGRDRELAAALVAAGWRADDRSDLLRAAVVSTASRDAVERNGCEWALSWSGPVALRRKTGTHVDVDAWATDVLAGTWKPLVGRTRVAAAPKKAARTKAAAPKAAPAHANGALPDPPQPPFAEGANGWKWAADLPSGIGRKAMLQIGADGVGINGTAVAFDDVARFSLDFTEANGGVKAKVALAPAAGAAVKMTATAMTQKGSEPIFDAGSYLWGLLTMKTAPRLCSDIVGRVGQGETVAVGGFVVSREGIATTSKPRDVRAWDGVGDPQLVQNRVVVPCTGKPLGGKSSADNVFLLDLLIPQLRALHG